MAADKGQSNPMGAAARADVGSAEAQMDADKQMHVNVI